VGLYKQPNDFTCGPYALQHALTVLGILVDPARLVRLAKTHWWSGTDEVRLARAARAYDCDMPQVRHTDPDEARRALVETLRKGLPVLVCVDGWEHWITVVHVEKGRFVVLDSRNEPVVAVLTWRELEARWAFEDEDDEDDDGEIPTYYDMHPVRPRFRWTVRARFSLARARFLRRPENRDLAGFWDDYVRDLREVCRPRSPLHVDALSVGEFLRRTSDVLVDRVAYWHGECGKTELTRVLRNMRFVADTYGMVVPSNAVRRATIDLTVLLALWAGSHHPVEPMYRRQKKRRRRRS